MSKRITLSRKQARVKLAACTHATYYIQVDGGNRYTKDVSVAEMVRAFDCDNRCRLRIYVEDSRHVVTITDSPGLRSGYDVSF